MDTFESFRAHCMAKDGATEDYPWGDVAWKIKGKMFACTSEGSTRITVKSTLDKQAALVQMPNIEPAHYVGRYGWVTVDVQSADDLDLAKELIDESFEMVGPKKKARPKI